MKYALVELYEDKFGDMRCTYLCKDMRQQGFIYTNPALCPNTVLFDAEEEAVEWGNYNIAPVSTGTNIFRVVNVDEKDIFVMRLEG